MKMIPTIKGSPQARLLIYRAIGLKLTEAEERLLSSDRYLWERILLSLDAEITADEKRKSDQVVLSQAFSHIDRSTREGLKKQIERLLGESLWLGVHASSLLDSFIDEHLGLIKSVRREYLDKVGFAIKRGIREGRLHKELVKDIRQMTDMSKRRAQLIARNAPLYYSGALTRHHQMSAGIKSYVWQSSRDERVRDSHRKFDGEIFSWDARGPYPRSEINCRCDAVPFLEGSN